MPIDAQPAPPGVRPRDISALPRDAHVILYCDEGGWGTGAGTVIDRAFLPSGTAAYLLTVAEGIAGRGYLTTALCQPGPLVEPLRRRLADAGARVETLENRAGRLARRAAHIRQVWRLARSSPRTVVLMLMGYYNTGGLVATISAAAGARVVRADLTAPEPPFGLHRRLRLGLRDLGVRTVVVGSAENRVAFAQHLGREARQIEVVWTGIDLARYRAGEGRDQARAGLGFGPADEVIGVVARLSDERKGVPYFLEASAAIAEAAPRARFLVVGDGTRRGELESLATRLGIGPKTVFAGHRSDIPQLLAAMDVFVMPSLFEGGPTILLEAMAMSRPVVATRVGMVPEVVAPDLEGIVVPPADAGALAHGVLRLLGDRDLAERMARAAGAKARECFSRETMVDRYVALLGLALNGGSRR